MAFLGKQLQLRVANYLMSHNHWRALKENTHMRLLTLRCIYDQNSFFSKCDKPICTVGYCKRGNKMTLRKRDGQECVCRRHMSFCCCLRSRFFSSVLFTAFLPFLSERMIEQFISRARWDSSGKAFLSLCDWETQKQRETPTRTHASNAANGILLLCNQ